MSHDAPASDGPSKLVIRNIGLLLSGDLASPILDADTVVAVDGKELADRLTAAVVSDGSRTLAADMVNPKVQVYGDTAVLTYNFVGVIRDKDGKVSPNKAKSTRVYSRVGGKWMLVHANFAPVN